ncbi:MAG: winged helix DNA-binding domain-containing protein, partial [Actinomycetota bacterium]|nr:winged helix DNA-binding domain-containing protein [Actinomycetota bacterium]
YVGLWSRLEGFQRDHLTRALQRRGVVQGTLMRSTIHLVAAGDYWPFAVAVRRSRRQWWLRTHRPDVSARDMAQAAELLRARIAGRDATPRRDRPAGRQAARARCRSVARPRPRAAFGHMGAPPPPSCQADQGRRAPCRRRA